MKDLFDKNLEQNLKKEAPLADRMRPQDFKHFYGQEHLIGPDSPLRQAIQDDNFASLIFWGPPGSGKTTLARIIATKTKAHFIKFSAVNAGVKEVRTAIKKARQLRKFYKKRTILFIDEIHRFNKTQQDALLPHVETGTVILIGATTENPSFEVISPLLSRSAVYVLKPLSLTAMKKILLRTLRDKEQGLGGFEMKLQKSALERLINFADGDARVGLNGLEFVVNFMEKQGQKEIKKEDISEILKEHALRYDKKGEEHYNIISALHKSMRGSDVNASLYWLARMLEAGEDPLYIARRIVRFASEDIGLANSRALEQAVAAYRACHFIGMPECNVNLAQAVVYMAKSKKSNALYKAYNNAARDVKKHGNLPVPLHIRNAPTQLMKDLEYGKGYKYSPDHDYKEEQDYLPKKLKKRRYLIC